jgi:hypothetical protein
MIVNIGSKHWLRILQNMMLMKEFHLNLAGQHAPVLTQGRSAQDHRGVLLDDYSKKGSLHQDLTYTQLPRDQLRVGG